MKTNCKQPSLSTLDFYKAKECLEKANCTSPFVALTTTGWVNFDIESQSPPCKKQKVAASSQQEVENTMNTERDYLVRRLEEVYFAFDTSLAKQFNIYGPTGPRTYKELIDWITNGKYTLDPKATAEVDDENACGFNVFYGIKWTEINIDWAGYNKANVALNKAKQAARDVIKTLDAAAGLKALQDFEAWTYTPAVIPVAVAA